MFIKLQDSEKEELKEEESKDRNKASQMSAEPPAKKKCSKKQSWDMFFVVMKDDPALKKVIYLLLPIHMPIRMLYYCIFTTCLYVQVTFNRDTVVLLQLLSFLVISCSDNLMHVGHVFCDNER